MRILVINLDPAQSAEVKSNPLRDIVGLWSQSHEVTLIQPASKGFPILAPLAGHENPCFIAHPMSDPAAFFSLLIPAFALPSKKISSNLTLKKFDIVLAASPIPTDNYYAHSLARKTNAAFIRLTTALPKLSGLKQKLLHRAESIAYRHAPMIVTTLPDSFDRMQSLGLERERWLHLPSTDPQQAAPLFLRLFEAVKSSR